MKKFLTAVMCSCLMLPLAACGPTTTTPTPPTEGEVRKPGSDYTHFWWNYGIGATKRDAYVQTGNYGFSLDARTGKFRTMGGIEGLTREQVRTGNNEAVDALPGIVDTDYAIEADGKTSHVYAASYVHNDAYPMSSAAMEGAGVANALRIISSGTYMQRMDIMQLLYKETSDYTARMEFAAVSDYFTFTYDAKAANKGTTNTKLSFSLTLDEAYSIITTYNNGRALLANTPEGQSMAFVLPADSQATLTVDGKKVTVSCPVEVDHKKWNGFSFVIIPGVNLGQNCIDDYYASQQVEITAKNVEPRDTGDAPQEYNNLTSAFDVQMPISNGFIDYTVEENRTAYERTPFTVKNNSDRDVRITLCFKKRLIYPYANYGLWGMSPMLVDPQTNEPTGIAVQYSRNPHNYISYNDVLYGSCWVNCYVYIDIPAASSVSYDFVCAFASWGETYASSIAQMCLVGWGGNQWWLSASLGSSSGYGETFGFDPERGCGRSLIDDSNPFNTSVSGGPGGADWISIFSKRTGEYRPITNQKVTIRTVGPNVSQMTVSGYLDNKTVFAEMTITITRSNDYARMVNTFRYEFLDNVEFSRMSFYSLGADNYNDNPYEELAYGTANGLKETIEVPAEGTQSKYVKKYIDIEGEELWVAQYRFLNERGNADKGMVVREYKAELNGKTYTSPTLSIYVTNNGCTNLSAELSPPEEIADGGVIQKGSVVTGAVEYVMVPRTAQEYIGTSEYIKGLADDVFGNAEIIRRYAVDGKVTASASVGELTGTYPTVVKSAKGDVVAEFTLAGGIGYVPVTITDLDSYSGYRLFLVTDSGEEMVDQSVRGNDYWQCYRNPDTASYELSFNVEQIGTTCTYRLKKIG